MPFDNNLREAIWWFRQREIPDLNNARARAMLERILADQDTALPIIRRFRPRSLLNPYAQSKMEADITDQTTRDILGRLNIDWQNVRQRNHALLLSAGGVSYEDYITNTISPLLWLRLNETSGNPVNHGSATGLTLSVSGATQGQTGQLGANEAYLSDGVDDIVCQIANDAQLANLTTQRWAFLVNATSIGENNGGRFFNWANSQTLFSLATNNSANASINTTGTNASTVTDATELDNIISAWSWIFADYDDADALGNGRVWRIFKGLGGTVTELAYSSQTPATGTVSIAGDLFISNRSLTDRTFDGLFDEVIYDSGLWTADEMQRLVDLVNLT